MKRTITILIALFQGFIIAFAGSVSERVYVSTDKDVYIAGDLVWCSAFCFDSSRGVLSHESSVAYVEISSISGTIAKGKIALIEGRGSGAIQIPLSASTGNYTILAYTSAGKGREDLMADARLISVFSTLRTDRVPGGVEVLGSEEYSGTPDGGKPSFGGLRIIPGNVARTSSGAELSVVNETGSPVSFSLSIHREDGIHSPSDATMADFLSIKTDFSGEAEDSDGEVFHGHLIGSEVPEDLSDLSLRGVIAFPGLANDVYVSRFNSDGTVAFKTVNVYGNRDMVCEVLSKKDGDFRLVIDSPFLNVKAEGIPPLKMSPSLESALIERSKSMQHERKAAADTLYDFMPKRESTLLSDTYCISYHLDDYTRFPTVQETLIEITPELRIRKGQGGKPELQVLLQGTAYDRPVYTADVLTMIDGVPIKDIQSLLDFDSMLLGDILIYPFTYQFGELVYKGVVDFATSKRDISSFKFDNNVVIVDWQGECYPVAFTCRNYPSGKDDLRNTIYWHPQLELKQGETTRVEFKAPSYPGRFKAVAEGISSDGTPLRTEFEFEVIRP